MLLYLRLLKESLSFAINALRNNKLRTLLSLLGVTIGIFSIIAVLAAVDSLDRKISKDLSSLDKNTIYFDVSDDTNLLIPGSQKHHDIIE